MSVGEVFCRLCTSILQSKCQMPTKLVTVMLAKLFVHDVINNVVGKMMNDDNDVTHTAQGAVVRMSISVNTARATISIELNWKYASLVNKEPQLLTWECIIDTFMARVLVF